MIHLYTIHPPPLFIYSSTFPKYVMKTQMTDRGGVYHHTTGVGLGGGNNLSLFMKSEFGLC